MKLYKINAKFARINNLPIYFVAAQLRETPKAVYLYGHGSIEARTKYGDCFICGKKLSHPGSMNIGIGPVCLGSELRQDVLAEMSQEEIERVVGKIASDKKVDQWLPRSVIKSVDPTDEKIDVPSSHPILNRKKNQKIIQKRAIQFTDKNSGQPSIKITFPFDRNTLAQVKTIPGRKYHGKSADKFWTAPRSPEAVNILRDNGFSLDTELQTFLGRSSMHVDKMSADIKVPGLKHDLFPFQQKGVEFIEARDGRALIADEMGLGKTVQAIAWLQLRKELRPAIIVVPASLKLNWQKEALHWMDKPKVQVLSGTKPYKLQKGLVIINYDILHAWADELIAMQPKALIMDEVHYTKNPKTKRSKAVKKIAKHTPHVIGLTGTPIVNRPIEILNALQMIDRSVVPNAWHFRQRYCGAKHNGFGWDFNGASNTEELHEKLTTSLMIRRKKADVLTDMPDKLRSFVPVELDNRTEYEKAEQDFIDWIKGKTEQDIIQELQEKLGDDLFQNIELNKKKIEQLKEEKANKAKGAETLVKIGALKRLAVEGKMRMVVSWIQDYLDSGEKLVVMAVHKTTIDTLMKEFGSTAVKVDGSVSGTDRQAAVEKFQNDKNTRLFVGNIQAAGVGLTLTASSTVAFIELPWTPGDVAQAEDRVHR